MSVSSNRPELTSEIRAGMAKKNMTQAELACELEVSESTLSAKMQGKSCFTIPQARCLVRVLDLNPLVFFPDYTPKMEKTEQF